MEDNLLAVIYGDTIYRRLNYLRYTKGADNWQSLWPFVATTAAQHAKTLNLVSTADDDLGVAGSSEHYLSSEEALHVTDTLFSTLFGADLYRELLLVKRQLGDYCSNDVEFMEWVLNIAGVMKEEIGQEFGYDYGVGEAALNEEECDEDGQTFDPYKEAFENHEVMKEVEENVGGHVDTQQRQDDSETEKELDYSEDEADDWLPAGSHRRNLPTKKQRKVRKPSSMKSKRKPSRQVLPDIVHDTSIGDTSALSCDFADSDSPLSYKYNLVPLSAGSKPFQCAVCGRGASRRKRIHEHLKRYHSRGPLPHACPTCGQRFLHAREARDHCEAGAGGAGALTCDVCGSKLASRAGLRAHVKLQHTERVRLRCELCVEEKWFASRVALGTHTRREHATDPVHQLRYQCQLCTHRYFLFPSALAEHVRHWHDDTRHPCPHCHKTYKERKHLQLHVDFDHLGKGGHLCDICGRSFKTLSRCNIHKVTHGEDRVACDICGKRFIRKSVMERHKQMVHFNEGRFKCSVCYKPFDDKTLLANHMNSHTGAKPFTCELCQRSFSQKSSLKLHQRTLHKPDALPALEPLPPIIMSP